MLSIEEFKEGCQFADGFDCDFRQLYSDLKVTMYAYPLFLRRVIEGMNEDPRFKINQCDNILDVYLYNSDGDTYCIKQIGGDSPEQAKEQAIKYILGELRK